MKFKQSLFSVLSLILLLTISVSAKDNNNSNDKSAVKSTVQKYVTSVDKRDASGLESIMSKEGNISILNTFLNKVQSYSLNNFVQAVKDGNKGGWTRNLNINSIEVNEKTAVADVNITDPRIRQSGFLTLVKDNGKWKITSAVFSLGSNK